jgi:peptidoglycan biosynthesis protein MviN/MurJ (putative lipid II flippase)
VQAFGRVRSVLVASVGALLVNAALSLALLLGPLGILGPPVAAVVAQACGVIYMLSVIRESAGRRWGDVFPWRRYAIVLVVALVAGAPLVIVCWLLRASPALALGAGAAAYALGYLLMGTAAGVITAEDRRYLGDLLTLRMLREPR